VSDNPYLDALDKQPLDPTAPEAPQPKGNPYLQAVDNIDAVQKTQLQASLRTAMPVNPDEAARARRLSSTLGIPQDVALRNLNQTQQQADFQQADKTLAGSPYTADRMRAPDFAQVAHDDLPELTTLEGLMNSFKRGPPALSQVGSGIAFSGNANLLRSIDEVERKLAAGVSPILIGDKNDLMNARFMTQDQRDRMRAQLQGSLVGNATNIASTQAARAAIPSDPVVERVMAAKSFAEAMSEFRSAPVKFIANVGPESLVQSGPGIVAAAIIPGGVAAKAITMGASSATVDYGSSIVDALQKEGVDVKDAAALTLAANDQELMKRVSRQAFAHSLLVGAFDAASGGVAGKVALPAKTLAARPLARELANVAVQTPVQGAMGAAGEFTGEVAAGQDISPGNILAEFVGEAFGTPAEVAGMAAGQIRERVKQGQLAKENAAALEKTFKAAEQSKLRERSPEAFADFVQQAAEQTGSPVTEIYIDAETFSQSVQGNEGAKLLALMPQAAAQMQDAIDTGGDIRIPIGELATAVPGTPLEQVFLQHGRTSPDALSADEAKTAQETAGKDLAKTAEKVQGDAEAIDTGKQSEAAVRTKVLERLQGAGRFTADVNSAYADLATAFYSTQAARAGMTPEEFFAKYPLQVRAESVAGGLLDQGGTVDSPVTSQFTDKTGAPFDVSIHSELLGANKDTKSVQVQVFDPETKQRRGRIDFAVNPDGTLSAENTVVAPAYQRRGIAQAMYQAAIDAGYKLTPGRKQTEVGAKMVSALQDRGLIAPGELAQGGEDRRATYSPSTKTISLLAKADLSSFLHEIGHFFLDSLTDLAARADAPTDVQQDVAALMKWFGVPNLAAWQAMSLEEQRASHEKFAESFEAYLIEGKSPSLKLQPLFQRFRSWMIAVYRSLTQFMAGRDLQLSDEVRGVFDRLLAIDAEIAQAETARNFAPLFQTAEEAGMTEEQFAEYKAAGQSATADAQDELQRRGMADMKWLSGARSKRLKEMQKDAAEKRKAVRREVEAEVQATPVYAAKRLIQRGLQPGDTEPSGPPQRLSIAALSEMYGGDGDKFALLDWSKLGYGKFGMLAEEGLHPDVVAEVAGFTSGDQMVRALLEAKPYREVVESMTDQRMLERYGDLSNPEAMARAVDASIHNEARGRFVATELSALSRAVGKARVLAAAARQYAEALVSRMKISEIRPAQFEGAEARAARAAEKALASGKTQEAASAKRTQLLNNYSARSAINALEEVDRGVAYLSKFERDGVRKGLDADYTDQIDALLDRFDLRRGTSLREIAKRKSLLQWVEAQREIGIEPEIPESLLNEANRTSYKDMKLEDFRGLIDTVKQIEHLGRLKHRLLTAQDQRTFDQAREIIVAGIAANSRGRLANTRTPNTILGEKLVSLKKFWASHIKSATLARIMDGGKDGGAVWEYLIRPANQAGDREVAMRERAAKDLSALLGPVLDQGKMGGKGQFFPTIDRSLNLEARLAIALNVGNESNLQRLLGGENWSREQLQPVLDSLTKEQWTFVQAVWDYLESYRPEIAAKERRVYGKEPAWIDPSPVETQFGTLRGGYYPVKYDPRASERAEAHADAEDAKRQMQGAYTSATTRRSFTKSRVEEVVGRPLLYSLDGIYNGVQEIIHDLSWHEFLIDANRLIKNKSIAAAMRETYGPEAHQQFKGWLEDVAAGEAPSRAAGEKALAWIRQGVSISGLGFNVMSAVMQPLGLTQSIVRVGAPWIARGVAKAIGSPIETTAEISEKSTFMRTRFLTRLREINEVRNQVKGQSAARRYVDTAAYALMLRAQQVVDIPTWWGAYEKAIADGNTENRAVALSDQAVIDSQGGGQTKDQSAIERGGPALKLFTTFYSFFNTALNVGVEQTMTQESKAKLAASYLLLYVVPAVLGAALKDALTPGDSGDWDDGQKLARKLAGEQLSYLFGLMFGLREIGSPFANMIEGKKFGTDYTGPAGLRMLADVTKLTKEASQGQADDGLRKAIVNFAGELLRLPSAQINRSISGVKALNEGKTSNPAAVVFGFQEKH
jgi:GNAT superfamily N-acetyltransferase